MSAFFTRDVCSHLRPVTTNGEPDGFEDLGMVAGDWGTPGSRDQIIADSLDSVVEAVFATKAAIEVGDRLVGLRGKNYTVTHWHEVFTHARVFLRQDHT